MVVVNKVLGAGCKIPWHLVFMKEVLLITRLLGTLWVLEKEDMHVARKTCTLQDFLVLCGCL